MSLSDKLREIADDIEDTEIDDVDDAQISFRISEDTSQDTSVKIGQIDDSYQGTVMATIFTRDY